MRSGGGVPLLQLCGVERYVVPSANYEVTLTNALALSDP